MYYGSIKKLDCANGKGIRTTLFVSGCTHGCKGCFNEESQDFKYGKEWTNEVEDKFIEYAKSPKVTGVSILGGEPLQQGEIMLNLVKRLRKEVGKPIWMWTGYTWEEVKDNPIRRKIVEQIDVLIDGKFELDKRDLNLKYKGSSNQRVINVQETINSGKISILT